MKNIEVEFRFEVKDKKKIRDFLDKLTFIRKSRQEDVYLDTKSGDLYKRGVFIRIRNGKSLDFKFNLEDKKNKHEDCDEYSFSLPISKNDTGKLKNICKILDLMAPKTADLKEFIDINKLSKLVTINKVREKFKDNEFIFCLDNVRGFGMFLEIESMAESYSTLYKLKKRMIDRVSTFNPKFLPTGYIELFVRKKDFNLYKQGRYILDEDNVKKNGAVV